MAVVKALMIVGIMPDRKQESVINGLAVTFTHMSQTKLFELVIFQIKYAI